jgi:4-carboxymuconolactone decarboxylase
MSRLTLKAREDLTPEQREQHDRVGKFQQLRWDGMFGGPFEPWIRSPELARRGVSFGNFIWERTTLDRRIVELAIIVTARFWQSNVEWVSHTAKAREHGVSEDVIRAVFEDREPKNAPEDELATYRACRALHKTHELPQDIYDSTVTLFGERGLAELIATIAYYTLVSMTLNAFEIGLEPGAEEPFPTKRA